ncbi:MAG: ABC transporter substrate-binding protein [Bauldia sp.]|nr:ABC transporter substrate-binding protein [Bauldia sp.]
MRNPNDLGPRSVLTRRAFGFGAAALLTAGAFVRPARAQEATRTVDTWIGPVTLPVEPQRVVAIDSRLDLEPAVALGLPLAGYCGVAAYPFVPVDPAVPVLASPPNIEEILSREPDLAICTDVEGAEDYWPLRTLSGFVPTLPVNFEATWQENLVRLGGWLGREQAAAGFIAGYEAALADLRARRGEAIANRKVAAIYFNAFDGTVNIMLGTGTTNVTLAGMVLDDLGGRGPDPSLIGEYGTVSFENLGAVLGDVDAILVEEDEPDANQLAQFGQFPIWQRLPAVAAGRVHTSYGTYYGGGYAALHTIEQWDAVYGLIG